MALVEYKFTSWHRQTILRTLVQRTVGLTLIMLDLDTAYQKKLVGWSSLVTDTIVGVSRAMHAFTDLTGNRYVAIGTDKFL